MKNKFWILLIFIFDTLTVFAQSKLIVPGGMRMTLEIKEELSHKFLFAREIKKCVMWEKATGRQLYSFIPEGESRHMQVSHHGAALVLYDDFNYTVFSTITGKLLHTGVNSSSNVLAFANDDSFIWSIGDDVKQIDTKSGEVQIILPSSIYTMNGDLYVMEDGNLLIVNSDGCQLYQASPFAKGRTIPFSKLATKMVFIPKAGVVAALQVYPNKASVELYSVATGKLISNIQNTFLNEYCQLIPSVDDNTLLCAKNIPSANSYTIYNAANGSIVKNGRSVGELNGPYLGSKEQLIMDKGYEGENMKQSFSTYYLNNDRPETVFSRSMMYVRKTILLDDEDKININEQLSFDLKTLRAKPEKLIAFYSEKERSGDKKLILSENDRKDSLFVSAADGAGKRLISPSPSIHFDGNMYFISADGETVYYGGSSDATLKRGIYKYQFASKKTSFIATVFEQARFTISDKRNKLLVKDHDYGKEIISMRLLDLTTEKYEWSKIIQENDEPKNNSIGGYFGFTNNDLNIFTPYTDCLNVTDGTVYEGSRAADWDLATKNKRSVNGGEMFTTKNELINFKLQPDLSWEISTKKEGKLLGTVYIFANNDYVFVDQFGRFDGTPEGIKKLYYVRNQKVIHLDLVYEKYYTPSLYERLVNGENFGPIAENTKAAPSVKMAYAEIARNLEVGEEVPTYTNTTGFAEITVTATAPEDAVEEIRLFHNGKIVTLTTRNLIVEDDKTQTAVKKYNLTLLPGGNNVRAIALNSERTESRPDEMNVNYSGGGGQPVPTPIPGNTVKVDAIDKDATMYLMVVGINAYTNKINPLTYALPDATAFKEEVEKDAKTVLANVKTYFIADAKADKAGIQSAFNEIKKLARPQDVLVFYYAGHGYIEPVSKEFYLVSSDVTDAGASLLKNGIPASELQQYAVDIQAQKQLFVLDACQSAGAFDAMLKHDGEQQKSLAVVARSTGTHWMAASGSLETAKEFAELGHGAFTYVLLQALKGQAAANKMITINGLKNFLQVQVPELVKKYGGNNQYPASYGQGNDFPVEIVK